MSHVINSPRKTITTVVAEWCHTVKGKLNERAEFFFLKRYTGLTATSRMNLRGQTFQFISQFAQQIDWSCCCDTKQPIRDMATPLPHTTPSPFLPHTTQFPDKLCQPVGKQWLMQLIKTENNMLHYESGVKISYLFWPSLKMEKKNFLKEWCDIEKKRLQVLFILPQLFSTGVTLNTSC